MIKELEALEKMWNYLLVNKIDNAENQYKIVEQTLKRNEPMKPLEIEGVHRCSNCGVNLHVIKKHNVMKYQPNYCFNCGQRVDWSEYNETNS